MVVLRRWFSKKFRLPITSKEWLDSYVDDLLTQMMEDVYEQDDELLREGRIKHLGTEIGPTGDPLIDMWEKQISEGRVPDLNYKEPENAKQRDKKIREAARRHYAVHGYSIPYKPPAPDEMESIQALEDGNVSSTLQRFMNQGKSDLEFDTQGYPLQPSQMSPEMFDQIGNANAEELEFNFERLQQFADIGEEYEK